MARTTRNTYDALMALTEIASLSNASLIKRIGALIDLSGDLQLNTKGLRVFELARAGLIYLSLGMHREERCRAKLKDGTKIMPMALDLWDDTWKK